MPSDFHLLSVARCAELLKTDICNGLEVNAAAERLKIFGPNSLERKGTRIGLRIFFRQLGNPMILLLLAAVGISVGLGHYTDAFIISAIVLLNTGIGFFQEYRAERAMESIRQMAVPFARVVRAGAIHMVPAVGLVPGDVIVLESGDRVPADLRLFDSPGLQVDESLLTGESASIFKTTEPLLETDLTLADRINMAFMGTHAVQGHGKGICVGTGSNSELGRIADLMATEKAGVIPMKLRMDQLSRRLVATAFVLCLVIFLIGLLQGKPAIDMLLAAMSLAIAAIPEGLPAVITISLSLGALRLSRNGVLVRRLPAVEALGAVTTICADKTGTLTFNRMEVKACYLNGEMRTIPDSLLRCDHLPELFWALTLANDARLGESDDKHVGDPMEVALLQFVAVAGGDTDGFRRKWPRIDEVPFDTHRKRMTTIHEFEGRKLALMKGAPETVLTQCSGEYRSAQVAGLTDARSKELLEIQDKMAADGLRILAVAMKDISGNPEAGPEENMLFLGLVGLHDPPRPEAKAAIAACHRAGIRTIMITGDHPATAIAIGRELGIYREGDRVITGNELKREGRALLDQRAAHTSIFARVTPEDKLKIIEVLQDDHQIVAMTGDGVNDAPALKKAEIGIAMGRGTDIAKEASALILLRENFATITGAVREGRVIYDNIRKFIRYMLTTNLGEITTMLFAMLLALPLPLLPVQLLWINLVTDGLPAVALGFEPAEADVMERSPREKEENILGNGLWQHTLWVGILMGSLTGALLLWTWNQHHDLRLAQTMTFTALVLAQMGHIMGIRSENRYLWRIGFFSNYRLLVAVLITILAQMFLLYLAPFNSVFHTVPLNPAQLLACFGLAFIVYGAVELEKSWRRRNRLDQSRPVQARLNA